MRTFDFSVAVGAVFRIQAEGQYLRYYLGSAGGASTALTVKGQQTGAELRILPGQSVRLPQTEQLWILVNNISTAAISGLMLIGDGAFSDDRISGEVSVIDTSKAVTLAGLAYATFVSVAAGVGQWSHAELRNAAGSGRRVILDELRVSPNPAGYVVLGASAVQLASGGPGGTSLRIGNPVSTCGGRSEVTATDRIAIGEQLIVEPGDPARFSVVTLKRPIVLAPGQGMCVRPVAFNIALYVQFFWTEEADA